MRLNSRRRTPARCTQGGPEVTGLWQLLTAPNGEHDSFSFRQSDTQNRQALNPPLRWLEGGAWQAARQRAAIPACWDPVRRQPVKCVCCRPEALCVLPPRGLAARAGLLLWISDPGPGPRRQPAPPAPRCAAHPCRRRPSNQHQGRGGRLPGAAGAEPSPASHHPPSANPHAHAHALPSLTPPTYCMRAQASPAPGLSPCTPPSSLRPTR
jgi:hypothetical protein